MYVRDAKITKDCQPINNEEINRNRNCDLGF